MWGDARAVADNAAGGRIARAVRAGLAGILTAGLAAGVIALGWLAAGGILSLLGLLAILLTAGLAGLLGLLARAGAGRLLFGLTAGRVVALRLVAGFAAGLALALLVGLSATFIGRRVVAFGTSAGLRRILTAALLAAARLSAGRVAM